MITSRSQTKETKMWQENRDGCSRKVIICSLPFFLKPISHLDKFSRNLYPSDRCQLFFYLKQAFLIYDLYTITGNSYYSQNDESGGGGGRGVFWFSWQIIYLHSSMYFPLLLLLLQVIWSSQQFALLSNYHKINMYEKTQIERQKDWEKRINKWNIVRKKQR